MATRKECIDSLNEQGISYIEITCDLCPSATNGECPWAYDPYNTDGDCLAVK